MKKIICLTALAETSPQSMPLGSACIASSINTSELTKNDFHAELFTFSLEEEFSVKKITDEILEKKPYAVCFSMFVWNKKILEEICKEIKKRAGSIVTIAGGPEITAHPESFRNMFDFTISGEGEEKILCVLSGKKTDDFSTCKLENLPSPYLTGTLDASRYGGALWELARGCPFKCSYCYESKGEKTVRYFSDERLCSELDYFAEKKIPQIFVLDPTYNADKKRAMKILDLIRKKTPDTFYYFEARAEFIDREFARAFSGINCCLQFGLQSSSEKVLKNVNRSFNKKKFEQNIGILNENGIVFGFDLIYGLPGDTIEGFKESIDFAMSLYPNNLELFCLSVLPGTALHDDAEKFHLNHMDEAPYNLISSDTFSEKDMEKARKISEAVNVFYTKGRAVPYFNAVIHPLAMKPSHFFEELSRYIEETHFAQNKNENCISSKIQKLQLEFVKNLYFKKNLRKEYDVARDLIVLNNALSEFTASGRESTVELAYHPDDIMTEYAMDIGFFTANCGKQKNRTKIFGSEYGADWKIL